MIFDSTRQTVTLPCSPQASHYHMAVGMAGTAFHHATLRPLALEEHEHKTVQVSVLFDGLAAVAKSAGGSGGGRRPRERRVGPGSAYIVPAGQPHSFIADSPGAMVNVYLAADVFEEGLGGRSPDFGDLIVTDDPLVRHLAGSLQRTYTSFGQADPLLVESAAYALVGHLTERFDVSRRPHTSLCYGSLPPARLRTVLDYVDCFHDRDIGVAELARLSGFSAVHFTRLFREATGYSPRQYVIRRRLAKARALLRSTDASVVDVALQAGFNSHAHFSAQFRSLLGFTPQTYRRTSRL